jgi:hypothetical protein
MGYGITVRTKPRIQVLKGFDPMSNAGLKQTAFVKSGVTIYSGQAITLEWVAGNSRYEWVLATRANALAGQTVYFADKDSTDGDVIEGGLSGYSSLGNYEIQTAFFKADDTYNVDTLLTISTVAGSLAELPEASASYPIVGKVTRKKTNGGTGGDLLQNAAAGVKDDSSTSAANSGVIVFQTHVETVTVS